MSIVVFSQQLKKKTTLNNASCLSYRLHACLFMNKHIELKFICLFVKLLFFLFGLDYTYIYIYIYTHIFSLILTSYIMRTHKYRSSDYPYVSVYRWVNMFEASDISTLFLSLSYVYNGYFSIDNLHHRFTTNYNF